MIRDITTVLRVFYKRSGTELVSLASGIACVALGLRTSHLVDVAFLSPQHAEQLGSKLRQVPRCQSLKVLQFKDRYTFVCHADRLAAHVSETLANPTRLAYVDVLGIEPKRRPTPPTQLTDWLRQRMQPFLQLDQAYFFHEPTLPSCMVALTGWVLDYPVVYVSHQEEDKETVMDEWEVKPNCLGQQPLHILRVSIENLPWTPSTHELLSFSYPIALVTPQEQQQLRSNMTRTLQERIADAGLDACVSSTTTSVTLDRVAL